MKPRLIIILAGFMLLQTGVFAATITVTVQSMAGPWNIDLNTGFDYGIHDSNSPTVIDASNGLPIEPGATIVVTYLNGVVNNCYLFCPDADANGWSTWWWGATNTYTGQNNYFPAFYMDPSIPVYTSELVGAFANNGAVVGIPFAVGVGPTNLIVPIGAHQLLLGINDNAYSDNAGAFTVSVSSVPEPTSLLLLGTGLGVIGFAASRRRK
jgi:hypothetical protein